MSLRRCNAPVTYYDETIDNFVTEFCIFVRAYTVEGKPLPHVHRTLAHWETEMSNKETLFPLEKYDVL